MKPYVYRGTQRGEQDPWVPKPKPEPEPPKPPTPLQPCGTKAAHRRHRKRGEDPCDPCKEARRAYDREWARKRKITPKAKAAKKEADRLRYLRNKENAA